jgi:AcrR family transcriptional regulator
VKARRSPVQSRAKLTVERILDAAAHVFGERGYVATTNEVAEAAGVSIGSLYQYFRDKDAILEALHRRHVEQIGHELLGRGPLHEPEAWVRWLVEKLTALNMRPDAQVLWETSRVLPNMRADITQLVDDLAHEASTVIGDRGGLRARSVVVTALAVVHEVVLPRPTPARRRAAVNAVLAVARTSTNDV